MYTEKVCVNTTVIEGTAHEFIGEKGTEMKR